MLLVINSDGNVAATHTDDQLQAIAPLYPGFQIVQYGGVAQPGDPDPRTDEEKAAVYRDLRRPLYPSTADQLDMIYHDQVNGTTVWRDTIAAIKAQYPKP